MISLQPTSSSGEGRKIPWAVAGAVAAGAAIIALVIAIAIAPGKLRPYCATWTVWGVEAAMVCMFCAVALVVRDVGRWLGAGNVRLVTVVFCAAFVFTLIAPRTNRILFDEIIYEGVAQSIALNGKANVASYAAINGGRLETRVSTVNKQPVGHPFLLSLAYRIFGVSEQIGPWLGRIVTAATAAVLFLLVNMLLRSSVFEGASVVPNLARLAGLAAALLLAATPLAIWWSSTTASEPSAALMNAIAVLSVAFYVATWHDDSLGRCRFGAGLLMAGALGGAVYFRMESLVVVVVAALGLVLFGRAWNRPESFCWLSFAALIATPQFMQLLAVREESWGAADGVRFSIAYVARNFGVNFGYFWNGKWFPAAFSLLAALGIFQIGLISRRILIWCLAWFFAAWGVFIFFYAGSYEYGTDSRFAVISAAPVALFAAFGVVIIARVLTKHRVVIVALTGVLVFHWSATASYVTTVGRQAEESRADIHFVRWSARRLPEKSVVLTNVPYAWHLNGISAAEINILAPQLKDMSSLAQQFPGGVYLHWGYWPVVREAIAKQATEIVRNCQGDLQWSEVFGQFTFGIIRLDTPWALWHSPPVKQPSRKPPGGDLKEVFPLAFVARPLLRPGDEVPAHLTVPLAANPSPAVADSGRATSGPTSPSPSMGGGLILPVREPSARPAN